MSEGELEELIAGLYALRLERGISRKQLAISARISPRSIYRLERENTNIRFPILQAYARGLGVEISYTAGDRNG